MLDARIRRRLDGPLARAAAVLDRPGVTPDRLTAAGFVLGLASAVLAAQQAWTWALLAWLLSRVMDGLDGPLARHRALRADSAADAGTAGGFLDVTADFAVYGATVVGVAIGTVPGSAAPSDWLPFLAVLLAYYLNGTAFLAFSSIAERTGHQLEDGRSLSFLGGLAEGAETIAVHSLWLLLPQHAAVMATVWAVVVGVSAGHRVVVGARTLRKSPASSPGSS